MHFLTVLHQLTQSRSLAALFRNEVALPPAVLLVAATLFEASKKGDAYNLLWALVFGFATLNILSLVAKRFDPDRNRMSFGEMMAVATVLVAVVLLAWEMLYMFKILPLHLSR